ncbi:MAG: DUF5698 domain-containing protein, partial [bacterium]
MEPTILLTGLLIFGARILDVSLGTVRTIVTVQGRLLLSFVLGTCEVTIWILVINQVIQKIQESPVLVVFFAFGFATGNVVGILVERELAFGPIILKVFTKTRAPELIDAFRQLYLGTTAFTGEGMMGPVTELYVVCRRRDLKIIIPRIMKTD